MQQRVSAILLAAGQSRRMGRCKQLLPLGDKPVIARCIEGMIGGGIRDRVVVVGRDGDAVTSVVSGYPVKIARNEDPESDMAESVRVGLGSIDGSSTGVIVALTDHPLVTPETYSLLLECHRKEPDCILIPVHGGKKGHPTLFPRAVLDELARPLTLRDLIGSHSEKVNLTPVPDIGVSIDMDTLDDYQRVKAFYSKVIRK